MLQTFIRVSNIVLQKYRENGLREWYFYMLRLRSKTPKSLNLRKVSLTENLKFTKWKEREEERELLDKSRRGDFISIINEGQRIISYPSFSSISKAHPQ